MGIFVKNATMSVSISLTVLKMAGLWAPEHWEGSRKLLYSCYTVVIFMFLLGIYIIIQVVDLCLIWGDIALMTGTAFLLFTNLAQAAKIVNILGRRKRIQVIINDADKELSGIENDGEGKIVKSCNKEMIILQALYISVTFVTTLGWATSAEKGQLPLRACAPTQTFLHHPKVDWEKMLVALSPPLYKYPYDTTRSPAYELTYVHQVVALLIAAYLNVAKDTLVAALIAQCRCRLRLIGHALENLATDLEATDKYAFTPDQETSIYSRLRLYVIRHQKTLEAARELQACFSEPTFAQFTVSLIIICVTAFQLSMMGTDNLVRLLSMATYLMNMAFQVFIYCYQGTYLSEESSKIASSVYCCPWYMCSVRLRRQLLIVMLRTRRITKLTAGGFTTLSLASFMAIIKASYSLFTLLQQVNEE